MEHNLISVQNLQDVQSEENFTMNESFLALSNPDTQDFKLKNLEDKLTAGFDGLTIESEVKKSKVRELYNFIEPFIYKYDTIKSTRIRYVLDYRMVTYRAIKQGIVINDTERDDYTTYPDNAMQREYKSSLRNQDPVLKSDNDDVLRIMHQSVSLTFDVNTNTNTYTLEIWFNPNKFVKNPKLQEYEPLYWFFKTFIKPYLIRPRLKELHLNLDLNMAFNRIYAMENGKAKAFNNPINQYSKYLNRATNMDYSINDHQYKHQPDTLIFYNKIYDVRHGKVCKTYFDDDDVKALYDKGYNITRFEFKCYNHKACKYLLQGHRLIGYKYALKYCYKTDTGYYEHNLKNALNRAYQRAYSLIYSNTVITDDMIHNTLNEPKPLFGTRVIDV